MTEEQKPRAPSRSPEISGAMPCLNEAETLARCIEKAQWAFRELSVAGEVVIGDNGSTDGSQAIAERLGGVEFDVHSLPACALLCVVGYQTVTFGGFTKTFAITQGLHPPSPPLAAPVEVRDARDGHCGRAGAARRGWKAGGGRRSARSTSARR